MNEFITINVNGENIEYEILAEFQIDKRNYMALLPHQLQLFKYEKENEIIKLFAIQDNEILERCKTYINNYFEESMPIIDVLTAGEDTFDVVSIFNIDGQEFTAVLQREAQLFKCEHINNEIIINNIDSEEEYNFVLLHFTNIYGAKL